MTPPATLSDSELRRRLRALIDRGPISLASVYGGTGAPGKLLEKELGLDGGGNDDTPDAGRWELKFHGGSSLLTLFHLEAKPKAHLEHLVTEHGWLNSKRQKSFRHTIHGCNVTKRGFWIEQQAGRILVRCEQSDRELPYWEADDLVNSFASKLRRLLLVTGTKNKSDNTVRYEAGIFYQRPRTTALINLICDGTIAVDFDARRNDNGSIRNHGTKLRIKAKDLTNLYQSMEAL